MYARAIKGHAYGGCSLNTDGEATAGPGKLVSQHTAAPARDGAHQSLLGAKYSPGKSNISSQN